jgi:hypothetical protein
MPVDSNPHSGGPGNIPAKRSWSPPYRAVARATRPHRTPRHRRANLRRVATPCGSGTASHRVRHPCSRGVTGLLPSTTGPRVARPPPDDGGMRSYRYRQQNRPRALQSVCTGARLMSSSVRRPDGSLDAPATAPAPVSVPVRLLSFTAPAAPASYATGPLVPCPPGAFDPCPEGNP